MNSLDSLGQTALHRSALINSEPVCRLLLQYGADNSVVSNTGHTALQLASDELQALLKG